MKSNEELQSLGLQPYPQKVVGVGLGGLINTLLPGPDDLPGHLSGSTASTGSFPTLNFPQPGWPGGCWYIGDIPGPIP